VEDKADRNRATTQERPLEGGGATLTFQDQPGSCAADATNGGTNQKWSILSAELLQV
jgi:hypothetical protein